MQADCHLEYVSRWDCLLSVPQLLLWFHYVYHRSQSSRNPLVLEGRQRFKTMPHQPISAEMSVGHLSVSVTVH